MAIYARIVNLDDVFNNLSKPPIILNEFNVRTEADKEAINQLILTQFGSDALESEPHCDCRRTKGGQRLGRICPHCRTEVVTITERALESPAWIRTPKGVARFINPKVWTILASRLTFYQFNILEHLVNPSAKPPEASQLKTNVLKYMKLEIPRGINYFYENFDDIIALLVKSGVLSRDKADRRGDMGRVNLLTAFLSHYRDSIFCTVLPLPTKLMMITEKTATTTFASSTMQPALNAVRTINMTESAGIQLPLKVLQSRAMKANALMAQYHDQTFFKFFDSKEGWYRGQVYGGRNHFTMRTVINSLSEPHDYDELHIPWSPAVMVFRMHILAKLMRTRGYTPKEAQTLIDENTLRYNEEIDSILKELIAEAPGGKIAILWNRNPSLLRGSIQLLYITKVKTDPTIRSTSISVLVLREYNADKSL